MVFIHMVALISPETVFTPLRGLGWLALGIFVLRWALLCVGLAKFRHRSRNSVPMDAAQVSPEVRRQIQPWLNRLTELGFSHEQVFHDVEVNPGPVDRLNWRLIHSETDTLADLRVLVPLTTHKIQARLAFHTFLSDRRTLVTGEPGLCDHAPAHWLCVMARFKEVGGQWNQHLVRLRALSGEATAILPPDPHEAMAVESEAADEASLRAGLLVRDSSDPAIMRVSRLRIPWAALKVTCSTLPWIGRCRPLKRKDLAAPVARSIPIASQAASDDLAQQDLLKYRKIVGKGGGLGVIGKLMLLVVTLGLFAWFWQDGNLDQMVGIIIGVLFLHEFGHWLPMKLFGYKNVTMFFIPGFGAAVSGTKHHAPAWQELIALLGGPLPGLFGGLAVMVYGYFNKDLPDLWLNAAGIAVALNAFNLLPFLPLDGGRIVDLLIFRDAPLLRVLFNGFSTLCVFGGSVLSGTGAFRYLAIMMAIGVWRDVKMLPMLKRAGNTAWAGQETDEDAALLRLFREARASGNQNFTTSKDWVPRTKAMVEALLRRRPGWFVRIAGLGFYGAVCMVPVLALLALGAVAFSGGFSKAMDGAGRVADFQSDLPAEKAPLTEEQAAPILKAFEATASCRQDQEDQTEDPDYVIKLAMAMPGDIRRQIDFLRWEHVGIALRTSMVDPATVNIWLEAGCQAMETAANLGRNKEAMRRVEIMLHALHSLEPAVSHDQRERLCSTQVRVLKTMARVNGTGAIAPEMQAKLKRRIEALRKTPDPALEAFLLVDGSSNLEIEGIVDEFDNQDTPAGHDDASFFRDLYRKIDQCMHDRGNTAPMSVALASQWKKSGKAGELPDQAPGSTPIKPAEAELLYRFVDQRREVSWHQYAVLSVISLDDFQRLKARLPERWEHPIPGGGKMELIHGTTPVLRVSDVRSDAQRSGPAWLGRSPDPVQRSFDLPLRPFVETAKSAEAKTTWKNRKPAAARKQARSTD